MQLDIEAVTPVQKRIQITVPVREVDSSFSKAYNRIAQRVSLPGFRKGRVPMGHLRKRYHRQATADVMDALMELGWSQALDEGDFIPLGYPQIDAPTPPEQGQEFVFHVVVEVAPDFEVKPYDTLTADVVEWTADDDVVEHELEHMAEHFATWEPVGDRDVAEKGDTVIVDYAGSIDGELFDGGSAEDSPIELGGGRLIDGFEEQIIGQKSGAEFDINVTFPDDYGAPDLAGKAAVFKCTIKVIQTKVTHPIDETLATKAGAENLDEVRDNVRKQLIARHQRDTDTEAKEQLKVQIGAAYDFPVPEGLLAGAVKEGDASTDEEKAEARTTAETEARTELVLDKIAERENIEVPEREIMALIDQLARSMGPQGAQIRQMYRDSNRRAGLRRRMRQDKVLDFLLTKANVTSSPRAVPAHDHSADHAEHDEGTAE